MVITLDGNSDIGAFLFLFITIVWHILSISIIFIREATKKSLSFTKLKGEGEKGLSGRATIFLPFNWNLINFGSEKDVPFSIPFTAWMNLILRILQKRRLAFVWGYSLWMPFDPKNLIHWYLELCIKVNNGDLKNSQSSVVHQGGEQKKWPHRPYRLPALCLWIQDQIWEKRAWLRIVKSPVEIWF